MKLKIKLLLLLVINLLSACASVSDRDKLEYESLARAVSTTINHTSLNWQYAELEPLLHPYFRNIDNFKHLYEEGSSLGYVQNCETGEFEENTVPEIPGSIKYSGICEFENGKAKVFILFGILEELDFIVFSLDVFPIERT